MSLSLLLLGLATLRPPRQRAFTPPCVQHARAARARASRLPVILLTKSETSSLLSSPPPLLRTRSLPRRMRVGRRPHTSPPRQSGLELDSTDAVVLATRTRHLQRPPTTPPPTRCPRCYGHHSNAAICRGRPVPGVTPGGNESPTMPPALDATHPSAPCTYHSSFRGPARHTNSECSRSPSGSPSKRHRGSPSQGTRDQGGRRGRVLGAAMVAEAGSVAGDPVWQPHSPTQAAGWASDDLSNLDWPDNGRP
jgi:hypothetical protein